MKTKSIEKVSSWLPIFSGFYETMWDDTGEENELDYINEQREKKGLPAIDYDAVDWDYNEYHQEVVQGVTTMIAGDLKDKGLIAGYKLEGLSSPREYNFANDSIHIEFHLTRKNINTIIAYINTHFALFEKYILDHYTSRSGFYSSYTNDARVWQAQMYDVLLHQHKLGSVLQFILENDYALEGGDEGGLEWDYRGNFMDWPWAHAKNYNELVPQ